jgi:hypothetical protein
VPYFDAAPAALQRMFRISDADLPDAVIIVGQWGQGLDARRLVSKSAPAGSGRAVIRVCSAQGSG